MANKKRTKRKAKRKLKEESQPREEELDPCNISEDKTIWANRKSTFLTAIKGRMIYMNRFNILSIDFITLSKLIFLKTFRE